MDVAGAAIQGLGDKSLLAMHHRAYCFRDVLGRTVSDVENLGRAAKDEVPNLVSLTRGELTVAMCRDLLAGNFAAVFPNLHAETEVKRDELEARQVVVMEALSKLARMDFTPMGMNLFPKQKVFFEHLRRLYSGPHAPCPRTAFTKMPTGMGKTFLMALIVRALRHFLEDSKVLVLSPRLLINEQNQDAIDFVNIQGSCDIQKLTEVDPSAEKPDVTVGTYQLFKSEGAKNGDSRLADHYDVILLDECQHAFTAKTLEVLRKKYPQAAILGFSATPYMGTSENPMEWKNAWEFFEACIYQLSLMEACQEGDLAPIRAVQVQVDLKLDKEDPDYYELSLKEASRLAALSAKEYIPAQEQGLVFCSGVTHAKYTAGIFNETGLSAAVVWGDMPDGERDEIIAEYKRGNIQFLMCADLLIEGFDHDKIKHVKVLRKTKSVRIYEQMIGRGARLDKKDEDKMLTVWDYVYQHSGQCTMLGMASLYGILNERFTNGSLIFASSKLKREDGVVMGSEDRWNLEKGATMADGAIPRYVEVERVERITVPRDINYYHVRHLLAADMSAFVDGIAHMGNCKIDSPRQIVPGFPQHMGVAAACENGEVVTLGEYLDAAAAAYGIENRFEALQKILQMIGMRKYEAIKRSGTDYKALLFEYAKDQGWVDFDYQVEEFVDGGQIKGCVLYFKTAGGQRRYYSMVGESASVANIEQALCREVYIALTGVELEEQGGVVSGSNDLVAAILASSKSAKNVVLELYQKGLIEEPKFKTYAVNKAIKPLRSCTLSVVLPSGEELKVTVQRRGGVRKAELLAAEKMLDELPEALLRHISLAGGGAENGVYEVRDRPDHIPGKLIDFPRKSENYVGELHELFQSKSWDASKIKYSHEPFGLPNEATFSCKVTVEIEGVEYVQDAMGKGRQKDANQYLAKIMLESLRALGLDKAKAARIDPVAESETRFAGYAGQEMKFRRFGPLSEDHVSILNLACQRLHMGGTQYNTVKLGTGGDDPVRCVISLDVGERVIEFAVLGTGAFKNARQYAAREMLKLLSENGIVLDVATEVSGDIPSDEILTKPHHRVIKKSYRGGRFAEALALLQSNEEGSCEESFDQNGTLFIWKIVYEGHAFVGRANGKNKARKRAAKELLKFLFPSV
jgi:dsRNA-specific ribonuclease